MTQAAQSPTTPTMPGAAMALVMHPLDDVATTLRALPAGAVVAIQGVAGQHDGVWLRDAVGLCHKFALRDIAKGAVVRKYGEAIGHATQDIQAGEHVHTHNLKSSRAT